MRYSVLHDGVPIGMVELEAGELVAGRLTPLPALDALEETIRAGSNALLALGFFGAATVAGQNGVGAALSAAAALRFDLIDDRGELEAATFVNVIEAPAGGFVVLARLSHAHAGVPARLSPRVRCDAEGEQPSEGESSV